MDSTAKMLKTGPRENVRGKWREGNKQTEEGRGRKKKDIQRQRNTVRGEGGRRRALGASRQSIWSINAESNGLTD